MNALYTDADISNLHRRIDYLNEEIVLACLMLGCEHPDEFLPTLRRKLDRLREAESGLARMQARPRQDDAYLRVLLSNLRSLADSFEREIWPEDRT